MRIIPVLDLKGGVVVHARRGQRDAYAPLDSPLVAGADPVAVARALTALTGERTVYVADLDAIAGGPIDTATLAAIAAVAEPWVDAGAVEPANAAALRRAGVARNIVGTESLPVSRPAAGREFPAVLSVDLRDGGLISPDPALAERPPAAAAPLARALEVSELIVIDLARVGAEAGPPLQAVAELHAALPGLEIYAGGGVRDDADLDALHQAGATGALVATALHAGRITPRRPPQGSGRRPQR